MHAVRAGVARSRVESTGPSNVVTPEQREQRLQSQELPPADRSALKNFFSGASEIGTSSNFGAMCEKLAAQTVKEPKVAEAPDGEPLAPEAPFVPETPLDDIGTELIAAAGKMKLALSSLGGKRRKKKEVPVRNGVKLAKGYEPDMMHVKSSHGVYRVDQPDKIEGWAWRAEGGNFGPGKLGTKMRECYDTLMVMIARGQVKEVSLLARMYGGSTPASRFTEFPMLSIGKEQDSSMVPLALETDTVLHHAERMAAQLRQELALGFREGKMREEEANSYRPCRCAVHTEETCQARKPWVERRLSVGPRVTREEAEEEWPGCFCKGPAPHLWNLCPNKPKPAVELASVPVAAEKASDEEKRKAFLAQERLGRMNTRNEFVEPLRALHDLLDTPPGETKRVDAAARKATRLVIATRIRMEAHRLLVDASRAYRRAKEALAP